MLTLSILPQVEAVSKDVARKTEKSDADRIAFALTAAMVVVGSLAILGGPGELYSLCR